LIRVIDNREAIYPPEDRRGSLLCHSVVNSAGERPMLPL
jgi:hypothetical protein